MAALYALVALLVLVTLRVLDGALHAQTTALGTPGKSVRWWSKFDFPASQSEKQRLHCLLLGQSANMTCLEQTDPLEELQA
jgi:hypothetical protein